MTNDGSTVCNPCEWTHPYVIIQVAPQFDIFETARLPAGRFRLVLYHAYAINSFKSHKWWVMPASIAEVTRMAV